MDCYQCDRPIGRELHRLRLKDGAAIHVVCLEYAWRETPAYPGGPKVAHDLAARSRALRGFSPVQIPPPHQ